MKGNVGLRVLGASAYPVSAASARVRVAQFVPFLRNEGINLHFVSALQPDEYGLVSSSASATVKARILLSSTMRAARQRVRDDELLLVHRLRLLNPMPGIDPPRALDAYDFDDALFLGSPARANRTYQWAKREAARALSCVRRARLVTAGNSFLAAQARPHARRVEVLPSCVDPTGQPVRVHADSDVITIGWIGSHTTSEYLQAVLPILERLNRKRQRVRLVVIGAHVADADWIEERPWSLDRQAEDLASFDVGIMPLPDTDWAKGKCGYKLLQYFAAGVPAVASPVGVNPYLASDGRGILAATDQEWLRALEELMASAEARSERGALARRFVESDFSYRRWAPELAGLLRSLT